MLKITVSVIVPWSYHIFYFPFPGMSEQWGTDLTCNSVMNSGPIIAILIYITTEVQSRL